MLYSVISYASSIFDLVISADMNASEVGQSAKNALNSVAITSQIQNMLSSIGAGLAAGGSILIAREIGKKDYTRARRICTTVFIMVFSVVIVLLSIVLPFAHPILSALGISNNLMSSAAPYFMIQMIATSVGMLNIIFLSVEKARGATVFITLINVLVITVKICVSLLFVYGLNIKEIWCLGLASLLANLCLTVYMVINLIRPNYIFRFRFKDRQFDRQTLLPIIKISTPIFLGKFVFSFGKVSINNMSSQYYDEDTTGSLAISNQLGGSVTNVIGSIEDTESTIVSQNLGAKKIRRALSAFYWSMLIACSIALVGFILVTIFNDQLVWIFARNADNPHEYAKMISDIFRYEKIGVLLLALNSAVLGLLYGLGYTKVSMILNLSRVFVFRIPSLWILYNVFHIGPEAVGMAMMISNTAIGLTSLTIAIVVLKRSYKKLHELENKEA